MLSSVEEPERADTVQAALRCTPTRALARVRGCPAFALRCARPARPDTRTVARWASRPRSWLRSGLGPELCAHADEWHSPACETTDHDDHVVRHSGRDHGKESGRGRHAGTCRSSTWCPARDCAPPNGGARARTPVSAAECRTPLEVAEWLRRQSAPTIAALAERGELDVAFLLIDGRRRWHAKHHRLIADAS